jgi:alkylation response protein AidB-like acyl-CoA dehydrogenase
MVDFQLMPTTGAGRRLVALAEDHASDFATRADQHDREGSFPFENVQAMQESKFAAAYVPEELGGLGVESAYDVALGINRLARGCPSTAIAINMHLVVTLGIRRQWLQAKEGGDSQGAALREALLQQVAAGTLITSILGSEAGTDVFHPFVEATACDEGWLLNGRKIFGTLSPVSNIFFVSCRTKSDNGYDGSLAVVPRGTPGMEIKDDWDAMGMRGSGSNDVVFTDCRIPKGSLVGRTPWGVSDAGRLAGQLSGNTGLVAAFLGIAETARDAIVELVKSRRKGGPEGPTLAANPSIQTTIAQIEVDLSACRAMFERTARSAEAYLAERREEEYDMRELHEFMKSFQCMKWFVNRKAIEIVDRALTASGGAGYLSKSQLSRLYRDVRAGPFMQPWSPNEAFEYIGRVALGLEPAAAN